MFAEHAGNPAISDSRFVLSIALVTLLAPTATDLYLASMPDIAKAPHTSYSNIQLSMAAYLVAQRMGQILFGPVIDRFRRRTPLLPGLLAFIFSSAWSGFSHSIESLLLSGFIQGLAGSLLLVICFSSVRDVAEGSKAALGFTSALMGCMHLVLSSLSTPVSGYLLPKGKGYWFTFLLVSALVPWH